MGIQSGAAAPIFLRGSHFFGLASSTSSQPGSLAQIYIDASRPQACEAAGTASKTYIKRTRPQAWRAASRAHDGLSLDAWSIPGHLKKCANAWQNLLKSSDRRSNASATKGNKRMKVSEARAAVGGLSQTSKMPCKSWGISAKACKTGGKLAKVEGTVCHGCYALKAHMFGQ